MFTSSLFTDIIIFILMGVGLGFSLILLYESVRVHLEQRKRKKKVLNQRDDIAFNQSHPEVLKYKQFMIDGYGIDEWVVEDDLNRIKTIKQLKKLNQELSKIFPNFTKQKVT